MLLPDLISKTTIIFLRRDFDLALEALDSYGEFQVEKDRENPRSEEYGQLIGRVEELIEGLDATLLQFKIERRGLLETLRAPRPTVTKMTGEDLQSLTEGLEREVSNLVTKIDRMSSSLSSLDREISDLQDRERILLILERFNLNPEALEEMRLIYTVAGTVPSRNADRLEKAFSTRSALFHHRALSEETEFIFVAAPSKYREEVEEILKTHHAELFKTPKGISGDLSEALETVDERLGKLRQEQKALQDSLGEVAETNRERLLGLREAAQDILTALRFKLDSFETERLVTVKGYVPRTEITRLRQELGRRLGGRVLVLEGEAVSEGLPTSIRNPSMIRPFELITRLYGLPCYREIDPTPFLAVTFPLIFGLMFGDVGHGLLLLIVGAILGTCFRRRRELHDFGWILAACGIGAIFAGLLFGEFFGRHLLTPLWFNPFEDVRRLLTFSLFVGITQIVSGFLLDFINSVVREDLVDAFTTSLPKLLFYVGSIHLVMVYGLDFRLWLRGPILFSLTPLFFLILGKPILTNVLQASGYPVEVPNIRVYLSERLFESGDLVTRLLSNTMSYARILALLIAHWALLRVTYAISEMALPVPVFGAALAAVVIVVGNVFVIVFEGLIVFIHTLRLHFYEWFSKFYQDRGVEFQPFRQSHEYAEITLTRQLSDPREAVDL